jgi:ATP-dependent DNA helicase PIF1
VIQPTFHEAAKKRGLIEEDNTLDECLTEATLCQMPSSLRRLFATILVFCEPSEVFGLWLKHLDVMSEDYSHNNASPKLVQQMVLIDIRNILQPMGKDIKSFPLPDIDDTYDDACGAPREIFEEASIKHNPDDVALADNLNVERSEAYDEIMSAIENPNGGLFFVDSPGVTVKTFLYRALLAKLHSQNKLVVVTTTSRVASSIISGGRTAHSRFKIPLTIEDGCFCNFTKQSGTTKLLRQASLIIWGEMTMVQQRNGPKRPKI